MLVRLALETRQHHAEADADRLALMEVRAASEYRAFLARIYGFEVAVETAVEHLPEPDRTFFLTRAKRGQLINDLVALGMSEVEIEMLPVCGVRITSVAQALGWMFVVERQSLLAGLISRHLERTCPAWIARAGSYLGLYAESTGARFRAFGAACCEHVKRSSAQPGPIASAANEAFRVQHKWYRASLMHEQLRARLEDPTKPRVIETAMPGPASTPAPTEPVEAARIENQELA